MPVALDLFCGEGGATQGYLDAGFEVIGIDRDQDALELNPATLAVDMDWREGLACFKDQADFIHASPPCQAYSVMNGTHTESKQEKLIASVRAALMETGKPFVIENVLGAKRELRTPIQLTGEMFRLGADLKVDEVRIWSPRNPGGKGDLVHARLCVNNAPYLIPARMHRARLFECHGFVLDVPLTDRDWASGRVNFSVVSGSVTEDFHRLGHRDLTRDESASLMGMPWGTKHGIAEAIPPAYANFIGDTIIAKHGAI